MTMIFFFQLLMLFSSLSSDERYSTLNSWPRDSFYRRVSRLFLQLARRSETAVSSTSSGASDKTVTRCPSRRACSRSWRLFLKRTASRYVFISAVISTNFTSSTCPTPSSRCRSLGMSLRRSCAPGGTHTAGVRLSGCPCGLIARNHSLMAVHDHHFFEVGSQELAVMIGRRSEGDAKPSDAPPKRWTTSCSPSAARRFGYTWSE